MGEGTRAAAWTLAYLADRERHGVEPCDCACHDDIEEPDAAAEWSLTVPPMLSYAEVYGSLPTHEGSERVAARAATVAAGVG